MDELDLQRKIELLELHRRRKHELDKQAAIFGASSDPKINIEREDIDREILKLQQEIDVQHRSKPVSPVAPSVQARELIIDILSNTYRRAFSLNFVTRFTISDDFNRVLKSIRKCRSFLQKNMVKVTAISPEDTQLVYDILKQAEFMEVAFERMRGSNDRIDGGGSPEITAAFIEMEKGRLRFLILAATLSERYGLSLPPVPTTEGVPFGVDLREKTKSNYQHPGEQSEPKVLMSLRLSHALKKYLITMGEKDSADIISSIIAYLHNSDTEVRKMAANTLGEMRSGPNAYVDKLALPELAKALSDPDSGVRNSVAIALCKGFGDNNQVAPALLKAIEDTDDKVRRNSIIALSKVYDGVPDALQIFIEALEDENPYVRYSAAEAIGNIGASAEKAVPSLTRALYDSDVNVRNNAAKALGSIGAKAQSAIPALSTLLNDEHHWIVDTARRALEEIVPQTSED